MQALVGQDAPFDRGRQQMKVLAGLEVTAKSVERTAEAIGADIAEGEQSEIRRAVQLDLPVIIRSSLNGGTIRRSSVGWVTVLTVSPIPIPLQPERKGTPP